MVKNKGITLIALIITIIILLILAGVTINVLIGDNGLFRTARNATDSYVKADMSEKLLIAIADLQASKLGQATLEDITQEWINTKIQDYECTVKGNEETNNKIITIKKDGVIGVFVIDEKLNITENTEKTLWFYDVIERDGNNMKISISILDDRGISKVEFPDQDPVTYNNQKEVKGIEYTVQRGEEYTVKVTLADGNEEEIKILVNDYCKVIKKLGEGISIDNLAEKVAYGSSYEATVTVMNSEFFLSTLQVTMGGEIVEVNIASGKIEIGNVTGDIEINAAKGIGTYLVKGGMLVDDGYKLVGGGTSSLEQKDGFVECRIEGPSKHSAVYWEIDGTRKGIFKTYL